MGKLRHLAIVVKDLEASCRFYEKCFDMKRAFQAGNHAVYLTDGLMNLAVLSYDFGQPARLADRRWPPGHSPFRILGRRPQAIRRAVVEELGGQYAMDFGDPNGMNFERKFTDPEGNLFDISEKGWYGALAEAAAKEPETV